MRYVNSNIKQILPSLPPNILIRCVHRDLSRGLTFFSWGGGRLNSEDQSAPFGSGNHRFHWYRKGLSPRSPTSLCTPLHLYNLSCPIKCECVELFCSICKVFTLRKDHSCPINKIKSIWQLSRQKYWNRRRQL